MASNVQFFGAPSVLQAYRSRGLNAWAVFQGKNLLCSGEDETSLAYWLNMLEKSTAISTLKVYNVDSVDDIDEGTPANGSFNFKLLGNSPIVSGAHMVTAAPDGIAGLIQRKLEAKMGARVDKWLEKLDLDSDEAEEKPQTIGSVLMGLLDEPGKIPQLIAGVKAILSGFGGQPAAGPQLQYIPQPAAAMGSADGMSDEQRYSRIGAAIETLERADPDIVLHLEKLASMSISNPAGFKNLIGMLAVL